MEETATCKRTLEFSVPLPEVEVATERAAVQLQKKVRLPGFRPGKVPLNVILNKFRSDIDQEVVEHLINHAFNERARQDNLNVVGSPKVMDVHFHQGEPLRFKAEFEVYPEFELGEYAGLTCPYEEPHVTDENIAARLEQLRKNKVEYVNIDPRPAEDGDVAVVAMKSVAGVEGEPVENNDMQIEVGDSDTMPEFSEGLRGVSPGEHKTIEVSYPENYAHARLAGRKVTFDVELTGLRRKELPELNDEFAQDLGDFKTLEELREEVRRQLLREAEHAAQDAAKNALVSALVESHPFPVPEAFVQQQAAATFDGEMRRLEMAGVDTAQIRARRASVIEAGQERARKDVKASMLLGKIAERESLAAMKDEVDRELQRIARQMREPLAAVRLRAEKDGSINQIANRIVTDKVLNLLFEKSRKVAPESVKS